MKKSNHTPEPWGPDLGPIDKDYYIEPMTLLTTRDYKRARACVNACAGINPEAVPDLLAAAKHALPYLERGVKFFKFQRSGRSDREFWPNREEAESNVAELFAAIAKAECQS